MEHRSNQKATETDDPMQVLLSGLAIPADPPIPVLELQGRCAKSQPPEPTVRRADQITHLHPHQRSGTTRVLAQHQLVPDAYLRIRFDLDQHQVLYVTDPGGDIPRRLDRPLQPPWRTTLRTPPSRGQHEMPGALQFPKGLQTAGSLRLTPRIEQLQAFAHPLRDGRARQTVVRFEYLANDGNGFRLRQLSFDQVLCVHAARVRGISR